MFVTPSGLVLNARYCRGGTRFGLVAPLPMVLPFLQSCGLAAVRMNRGCLERVRFLNRGLFLLFSVVTVV